MTPPPPGDSHPHPSDPLAERLGGLRDRLREMTPGRPVGLSGLRRELDTLRIEADQQGRAGLARSLHRLSMMTEVWECLAAEGPGSADEAASFCVRAIDHLVGTASDRDADADDAADPSWIFQESSACWSDYLALIDPSASDVVEDRCDPQSPPAIPPAIDAESLVRMLTGGGLPSLTAQAEQTAPSSPEMASERRTTISEPIAGAEAEVEVAAASPPPAAVSAPISRQRLDPEIEIDPEYREAFLAEASDLFERIESLVLSLGRGPGQSTVLNELGRCFHTLKGAAGSVGLIELASRVHFLEERLEAASGVSTPELIDQLHQSLSHLEGVLAALRQGSGPISHPGPKSPSDRGEPTPEGPLASGPAAVDEIPGVGRPAPSAEPADGPLRIPAGRMDELMDLASELIMRRGVWAAQTEQMKKFAVLIRNCRNELLSRLDQLNEFGIIRSARAGADPSRDLSTDVLRLAEQAEDLVVLAESAQARALPLADESDTLARLSLQLWESLQSIRIVPIRGLFQRLARVAHDAARVEGREVEVVMIGEGTGLDRAVQDKAFEPLLHIVRNAVGHGIERPDDRTRVGKPATGRVTLEASREGNTLVLAVEDDGRGLDYSAIAEKGRRLGLLGSDETPGPDRLGALIFVSGFSTRQEANAIAGRGVGMDVVAQEVRRLRGTIDLTSRPGLGTRMTIRLPARLALEQAMIARVADQAFAVPVSLIEHAQSFEPGEVSGTGSDVTVLVRGRRVPLIVAREALGFSTPGPASCPKLLLIRADNEAMAVLFDAIEGTQELVIKPLGPLLAGHPVISGTSLSLNGDAIFVLNPSGLFRGARDSRTSVLSQAPGDPAPRPAPVLVVDDSISVRRVVTRQLRSLGLDVEEVSNGVEALGKLSCRSYSMVLTDLEMPRMDGFELLAELRRSPALASLPVIVASTESRPATQQRVLDLGAYAFVSKPIDQEELARVAGKVLNRAIGLS